MKLKKTVKFCALILLFCLLSCSDLANLESPKSISIETEASYSAPLGNAKVYMSDYLNVEELNETLNGSDDEDSAEIKIYDYNPTNSDSAVQQFIIDYPIENISVDVDSYLEDLDLDNIFSDAVSQEIEVSEFSCQISESYDLPDINAIIAESFSIDAVSISVIEGYDLDSDGTLPSVTISVSSPDFEGMTFTSGSLDVTVVPSGTSSDFVCEAQVLLLDSSGETISSSDTTDINNGGSGATVSIPLSGKTITSSMKLALSGSVSGGSAGNVGTFKLSLGLSDSELYSITGLNMSADDLSSLSTGSAITVNQTVSLDSMADYLVSATIGEGSMSFSVALPSNWSGVYCSDDLAISGGIDLSASEMTDANTSGANYVLSKDIDLSGKTITPSDILISGSISLYFKDADIYLSGDLSASFEGEVSISTLKNAEVKISGLIGEDALTTSVENDISESLEYVESLTVTYLAMTGTIETDLDLESAQISLYVLSDVFNFNDEDDFSDSIDLSDSSDIFEIATADDWTATLCPQENSVLDFDINVDISGSDSGETVIIGELKLGSTYYISAEISFEFDWEEVTLNLSSATNFEGTVETSLNFRSLLEDYFEEETDIDFLSKIKFNMVEGYVFASRPSDNELLSSFSHFLGKVKAVTYDSETGEENVEYLIGGEKYSDEVEIVAIIEDAVTFESVADENMLITTDSVFESGNYSYKISSNVMTEFINSDYDTCEIEYEFTTVTDGDVGSVTIKKDDIESLTSESTGTAELKLSIAIVLSFELTIVEEFKIDDLLTLAGNEIDEDLMGRDEAYDDSDNLTTISDLIEQIICEYQLTIKNISDSDITSLCKAYLTDEASGLSKQIKISDKEQTLALSSDEIYKILTTYPFMPKIALSVYANELSVKRNAYLYVSAKMTAVTDGVYKVWGD